MGFHFVLCSQPVIGAEGRHDLAVLTDRFAHALGIGDRIGWRCVSVTWSRTV
ncbi:hypothetical protein J2X08_001003 [Rhizobium rosettiformans]|nr:hypothetical protein [Rhizobium rosettiformans]MDR7063525.1 hypothetical protein [Rhizobium rosettiformans]